MGVGDGGAEVVGALICSEDSVGSGISRHSRRDAASGASDSSGSLSRRTTSSYRMGEVLYSLPVDSKSEASTMLSRRPCIFGVLMKHHRELWSVPLTFLYRPAVQGLRPGFSPVSLSGNL